MIALPPPLGLALSGAALWAAGCLVISTQPGGEAGTGKSGGSTTAGLLAGGGACLSVDPGVLDFGNTVVTARAEVAVVLSNGCSGAVTDISAAIGGTDGALFGVQNVPVRLEGGASAQVSVLFAPLALEARALAFATFSAGNSGSAILNLLGEPIATALSAAPSPLNFGYVSVGATENRCLTLTNQSNISVDVSGIASFETSGGSSGGAFALVEMPAPFPTTLPPSGSASVCFSFTPPQAMQYSAQVTLFTTAPGPDLPLSLLGSGGGPQISCDPTSLVFGPTPDFSIATLPVLCANSGSALSGANLTLELETIGSGAFSAQFSTGNDPYPVGGLVAGQTVEIDVSYAPSGGSEDQGSVIIDSNAGAPAVIPVSGIGEAVAPCQFSIVPPALDFGDVPIASTPVSLSLAIENVGTDICLVKDLTIQNDVSQSFHIFATSLPPDPQTNVITIPAPGGDVPPSLTLTLGFEPTDQDAFSAQLAFSISDPDNPDQTVSLSGSSLPTCLSVSTTSIDFGTLALDDAGAVIVGSPQSFTVSNQCRVDALLQSLEIQSGPGDVVPQFDSPFGPPPPQTLKPSGMPLAYDLYCQPTSSGTHTGQVIVSDGTVDTLIFLSCSSP